MYRIDSSGSFSVVHFFSGDDGDDPYAELTPASDGFLYGTTVLGGEANAGTIFRLEPATGAVITVHSFTTTPPSGSFPYGRLTQGSDGFLYGTTAEGGVENLGAVYRLDPATGVVTSIHSFTTTAPSSWGPHAGLTQASNGFLYGTTLGGGGAMGLSSSGTVYRLHPATGEVTTLHSFTWMGPGKPVNPSPYAGLTQAGDGFLYGTTAYGGAHGTGSIYRLDPATDEVSTVYSFTTGQDGRVPFAALTQATRRLPLRHNRTGRHGECRYGLSTRSGDRRSHDGPFVPGDRAWRWESACRADTGRRRLPLRRYIWPQHTRRGNRLTGSIPRTAP